MQKIDWHCYFSEVIQFTIFMSTGQNTKTTVAQIMQRLLDENPNDPDIKRQLKVFVSNSEKHMYHGLVGNQQQYLQTFGLTYHEEEHFNYINQILHQRTVQFLDRIAENKIQVKSTLPPPPPPPPQTPQEIVRQVEQVLNNIDLPLSLFKRQDHYWSQDNPKTIQVKQYLKDLHDKDRQWKSELKKKRQQILNQKNQQYHRTIEQQNKFEQKTKQEQKIRMIKKIQQIKSMADARKRTIQQSLDFMKKQGRPLFKKMEQQFYNKVELPSLQQKKRKLTEVRELRRSVDLNQIQQHKQKYDKIKEQHEGVKIQNQPVKVSFKSQFYKSMEKSNVREDISESRAKSLVDRRIQYAQMIKDNFKPTIDEEKVAEVNERIENMKKRFTRAKNQFKRPIKGQDEEEQQQQQEQQQPEPEPQPQQQEQEDEQDDQFKIVAPKDDQYEPSHQQRYKMGLQYLQIAKSKRKALQKQLQQKKKDDKNQTFTAKDISSATKLSPNSIQMPSITLIQSNQSTRKVKYRNYLHQMSKTNKTIDFIDTSRIKNEFTQDMKIKNKQRVEQISNKIRTVQEKAKQEQELLKYKKVKKNQAIGKKLQLDNAIIDTIKARLAMMNN